MVEVIDRDTQNKMMAMMFCKIGYQDESYAVYCIRREKEDANVFISRLVKNSEGYVLDDDFVNGEKEVIEGIIKKLFSKIPVLELEQDGFSLSSELVLSEGLTFDIKKCYVTTVSKKLIKDCMINYNLVTKNLFDSPLVEVQDEKKYFSKGFVSNILLIIFGITVLLFSIITIIGVIFK